MDDKIGNTALFISGDETKFPSLFSWDDVNDVLNHGRQSLEGVRLVYQKKNLDNSQLGQLDHWLNEGATLVINNVNQIDPILRQFASSLEYDLNTRVNINSYMSCPTKQGFDNHFDRHDVFIIQTEGEKKWVVFEPTKRYPIHNQRDQDKGPPPESRPYLECTLTPGDVLYIPRGHWHYAIAETPSIHLTVGPQSRNGAEFLQWVVNRITDSDDFLRKDFPLAYSKLLSTDEEDEAFNHHFDQFKKHVIDLIARDSLKEAFIEYCMEQHPLRRTHQLPHTWALPETILMDTTFIVPQDQKIILRFDEETSSANILLRGKKVILEEISKEVLSVFCNSSGKAFNGHDLKKANSKYSNAKILEILLTMYRHGIILVFENDTEDQ